MNRILAVNNTTGSVEHYYHFLFAVMVPLLDRARDRNLDGLSWIRCCGPMNRHLELLQEAGLAAFHRFDRRQLKLIIERLSNPNLEVLQSQECYDREGLRQEGYSPDVLRRVAAFAKARFYTAGETADVLLVERGAPEAYYLSRRTAIPGSARTRRSIPNLEAIATALKTSGRCIRRVQLERVDLPEQIALFSRATTVIAQHGAGLANVLWMPPGSQVIEIIPDDQDRREHFSRLAEVVGARYSAVSQVGPHAAVEPESIVAAVHDLRAAG